MPNYRGLNITFVDFGGGVTSDSLFCDKEQPLFDAYEHWGKNGRYRRALDIGANIGVHAILMAKQFWEVRAFEPDPAHFEMMCMNVDANLTPDPKIADLRRVVHFVRGAVSDHYGTAAFVRVNGNTTGSHLDGDKQPYGPLERFTVDVVDCRPLIDWADFAKIDCEGGEARILLTVTPGQNCEFMVEVGNEANAEAIFRHFKGWRGMWAQHSGWQPVDRLTGMPAHHSQGALFIGREPPFK